MTTTFRYGNPAFDCDGAQIHAHCRQLATVVGVSGAIHPDNLDRLTAYASRFILGDKPFVLDLSGVLRFAATAVRCWTPSTSAAVPLASSGHWWRATRSSTHSA